MRILSVFGLLLLALCLTAGAEGQVVYVDQNAPGPEHDGTSWDTAYLTIQEGVDAAAPGGEVWVADGTYLENIEMAMGVAIYGGFLGAEPGGYEAELDQRDFVSNVTTIDGNRSGSCVKMEVYCRIDGFTIANGSGEDYGGWHTYGGGILAGSLATIANNIIANNTATDGWGGGVLCGDLSIVAWNVITGNMAGSGAGICCAEESSPIIAGNVIVGNAAEPGGGGIHCDIESSPTVIDNVIVRNSAYTGGGMECAGYSCAPDVIGNTICYNYARCSGGGIYCTGRASVRMINNIVCGNTAAGQKPYSGGGGIDCSSSCSLIISGNIIAGNTAEQNGGAIQCYNNCSVDATCNTICGNAATKGQALACYTKVGSPSTIVMTNCIVRNGGDEVWNNDGSTITITYSNVQGGWPGEGNIDADPMFVNPAAGDWHLTLDSPCIDAGWNGAPGLPETDWDGEDRIVNGTVDIGADEYLTHYTEAPIPQPECDGPLFGGSQSGFPAWVWFSIPLTPDCVVGSGCADPNALLGLECDGRLWYWDKYGKFAQVYQPPFLTWDLSVGDSYLLYLETDVANPSYEGITPFVPWAFEFKLGRMGWTWVGMPGLAEVTGDDFMSSVTVKYPSDDTGEYRTAQADYDATPDNWITWSWAYWNTWLQAPETFTPYAPFGHNTCYPWLGYRVWINVGAAADEDDPDQVTLIWP